MKQYTREQVLKRLNDKLATGRIIVAAGAGTGISAKFEEEGGADLILVFNSGLYRMHGLGSLSGWMAYGNANEVSLQLGERYVLPVVKEVPVICSVNGTDPTMVMEVFLRKLKEAGFSGINNFPTIGMIDGNFRAALEDTGISYDKEVAVTALAHDMGFFTTAYAFTPEEARKMAEAGCDCLLAHVGLTVGGSIGAKETMTIEEAAHRTKAMAEAAWAVNQHILVLCHGGPISSPSDVEEILKRVPIHGFVGASSMERLPVEKGIRGMTAQFAAINLPVFH
ncbi:MAG: phosphoenolpyruvate hydrolase family protein [Desulfobacteraceae bacterium]|jgi:predicted TIM-barrel enzyme